ncbi:hypothetical protein VCRA2119O381_3960002 [Vibrio crassostreae]|nr:hypothetical protein VCRA2119O381_3960002 [Vibrio crassostreae]
MPPQKDHSSRMCDQVNLATELWCQGLVGEDLRLMNAKDLRDHGLTPTF